MLGPDGKPAAIPVLQTDSRLKSLARVSGGALLGVASAAGSALASYVSAPRFPPDGSPLSALSSAEVLRVANTLSALLQQSPMDDFKMPELPQMVVVGTQSSGKSSLLNAVMACDLLPLGDSMVTRCPLHLHLVHAPAESANVMRAEFGTYASGTWHTQRTILLGAPNPSPADIAQIRHEIESQTCALAGPGKGISAQPIHLRLHSPFVPDLSLVDLPGLTQMALVEQGQPRDIKEQIRTLVRTHIDKPRAVILAVLPARVDLEADAALELVKEVDPRGERTIGVLTKIDLVSPGSDVGLYLTDDDARVPAELRLAHGYYAVRNRPSAEVLKEGLTVDAGFEREAAFFAAHPAYAALRPSARARLGVPSLARALSRLLVSAMHVALPAMLEEIREAHARTQREALELGGVLPRDEAARLGLAQSLLAEFCREFVGCLSEKRAGVQTGRRIKDAFVAMRAALASGAPVSAEAYPDAFIADAVKDCEGNHLSFPVPPIEVLEQLLLAEGKAPIAQLLPPCLQAADDVKAELRALCEKLCASQAMLRFPRLRARVREDVFALLGALHGEAVGKLRELVAMEEAYISTEDPAFLLDLSNAVRKLVTGANPGLIREILRSYFATVQRSVANAAPKCIMLFLVHGVRARLHAALFESVARAQVCDLLEETDEVRERRETLHARLSRLAAARQELEQCARKAQAQR